MVFYDTLEEFYLAEELEDISAWSKATADHPIGICGPIGPTEQLPLVARLVNEFGIEEMSARRMTAVESHNIALRHRAYAGLKEIPKLEVASTPPGPLATAIVAARPRYRQPSGARHSSAKA
jgi:hypothetical protein